MPGEEQFLPSYLGDPLWLQRDLGMGSPQIPTNAPGWGILPRVSEMPWQAPPPQCPFEITTEQIIEMFLRQMLPLQYPMIPPESWQSTTPSPFQPRNPIRGF